MDEYLSFIDDGAQAFFCREEPLVESTEPSQETVEATATVITAEENIEEVFNVPASLLGTQDDTFMLRVQGESMINAGIYDGDYIFVKEQNTARNGEINASAPQAE